MTCPKCNGRRIIIHANGGGMTCTACSGSGISSQERKARAADNRAKWLAEYRIKKEEIETLKLAIQQFTIMTNMDTIVRDAAIERLRQLEWRLMDYAPRNLTKEELE